MKRNNWVVGVVLGLSLQLGMMPRNAHAIAGVASGMIPMAVVGGAFIAAGAGTVAGLASQDDGGCLDWDAEFGLLLGLPMIILGIVLLDESKQVQLSFQALPESMAATLHLEVEQIQDFNTEVEELNAARQSIEQTVAAEGSTEGLRQRAVVEWQDALEAFSPGTRATIRAMGENAQGPGSNVDQ